MKVSCNLLYFARAGFNVSDGVTKTSQSPGAVPNAQETSALLLRGAVALSLSPSETEKLRPKPKTPTPDVVEATGVCTHPKSVRHRHPSRSQSSSSSASGTMSAVPIFVDTNLDTHFAMDISPDDAIADLKSKLEHGKFRLPRKVMVEHRLCFPDIGEITISAAKVRRNSCFYRLSDTMCIRSAFSGIKGTWHIYIDAASTCLMKNQVASKETLLESENGQLEIPRPLELPPRNILADVARHTQNDVLNHFPSEKQVQPDSGTTLLDHCHKSILHGPFNKMMPVPDDLQQHEIKSIHTQNRKGPTNSQFTSVDRNREASRSPGAQDPQPELGASTSNTGQRLDLEVLKRHDRDSERRALEWHLSAHDNASGKDHGGSSEYLPSAFVSPNMGDGNKKRVLEIDSNLEESLQPAAVMQKRQKRERQKEDSLPPEKDIFDDATAIASAKEISEVENPNSEEFSRKSLNNDYPSFQNHVERKKKKSSKQQDGVDSETTDKTGLSRMPLPPLGGPGGVIASEKTVAGGNVTSTDAALVIHQATESHDHLKSGATQDVGRCTSKTCVAASDLDKISMNVIERKLDSSGNTVTFEEKKAKKPRRRNSSKCSSVVSAEDGNVTADTIPLEMLAEAVVRDAHNVEALQHESLTIADENVNRPVAADAACSPMASSPNEVAGSKGVAGMDVSIPPVASADKQAKPKRRRGSSSEGVDPPSTEEHGNVIKDAAASTYIGNNDVNNHELDETRKETNIPTKTKELKVAGPDIDNSNYELGPQEAENRKDGIDSSKLTDGPKVKEFEEAKVRRGKKSNKTRGSSRTHADDNIIMASEKKNSTESHSYTTKEGTIALQAENVTNQQTENSNSQLPCLEGGADGEVNSVNTATASEVQTTDFRVEKGRRKLKRPSSTDASELLTNQHDNKVVHHVTSIHDRHDKTGEVQNESVEKEHEETGEIQNQNTGNMKQEKALPRKKKKVKPGKTDSKDPVSGSIMEGENNVGMDAVGPEKTLPNILEHGVDGKHQKSNRRGEISVINSSMNEANNDKSVDLLTSIQEEHDATVEVLNPDTENMKQEKPSPRKKKKSKSGKTNSKDPVSGSMPVGENSVGIETVGSEQILQKILEHDSGGKHQNSNGLGEISVMNSSVNEAINGKAVDLASSIQERHDATFELLHQNMENMKREKASPRKKRKLKSGKTNSKDQGSGSITERENDVGIKTVGSEKSLPKIREHDVGGKHQKSNGTGEISVVHSSMDEANDCNIDFKKFFVSEEKQQQLAVDPAVNLAPGEAAKKSLKERPDKVARKPDLQSEDSFHLRDPNLLDRPKHEIKIHDGGVGNIENESPLSRNDEDKNAAPPKRNKSSSEKVNNASGSSEHQYVSSPPNHNRYRNRYRVAVRKVPSKKFGVVFNSSDLEKNVPAPESIFKHISSESSQDEGEVNDSDATTIDHSTDSSSASAHSDEEQDATFSKSLSLKNQSDTNSPIKGPGVSSALGGKNKEDGFADANLSQPCTHGSNTIGNTCNIAILYPRSKAAKNSSIRRVLRGSSAYKKARATLSQSRQDDFDSQPDMVPDSQGVGY
ncbi:hypothetical protein ACLOJK_012148 [Asimina triloba]